MAVPISNKVRAGSLIDLVRSSPEAFGDIGFVFIAFRPNQDIVEAAEQDQIDNKGLPSNFEWCWKDTFSGWGAKEYRKWPESFFEFWMPSERVLSVYARTRVSKSDSQKAILARRSWRKVAAAIPALKLPTRTSIAEADKSIAMRFREGKMFVNATYLLKEMPR